jgi:cellulose synthase/poly-beta-1,6-N-acetylglucosamine synthase-like glycosyltransferase
MTLAVTVLLWLLAAAWCVPAAVFAAECAIACAPRRARKVRSANAPSNRAAPRVAVVVPAHNEEPVIGATVRRLKARLRAGDRVLVVAVNCSDGTAEAARQAGADVTERFDTIHRGKGFALAHAFELLAENPPDVVFILDADCRTAPGTVRNIADLAHATGRPVQSLNLCAADRGGLQAIAELSLRFKNLVRPLGLARLGLPCHLMGTGMALPWRLIERLPPLGEDLAEDMRLGVDLALTGTPPLFSTAGRIESGLPSDAAGFVSQRTRWEQGHLRTLLTHAPRLIASSLCKRRLDTLALGLDLLVPPLTLFVFLWFALLALAGLAWVLGGPPGPAATLLAGGSLFFGSLGLGWFVFCRRRVPVSAFTAVPGFVLRKVPIYLRFLTGRGQKSWVRTPRSADAPELVRSA